MADVPNLDEAMKLLEKKSIRTSAGSYVKLEDVKELMEARKAASAIEAQEAPKPKDMNQAKQMVLKDEEVMKNFPAARPRLGRSIPASESQPPSRA